MSNTVPATMLEQFSTFGDLLRFLRRRAGITQMEFSLAVGYSDAQISRLEQNLRLPDIPTIQARFVTALGLEREPLAVARLLELAANVRREDAPGLGLCPFKGLSYFDEADADLFVGREALAAKLAQRILAIASPTATGQGRFLAVVGASGSGKSSLLRAGVIPALRWDKSSSDWDIRVMTPTARPLESLASKLTAEDASVIGTATLTDDLARDPRSLQIFARRRLGSRPNARLLLAIDQFEELFTLCHSEAERAAFVDSLMTAASETDGSVIVVVTLRADFYSHCAAYAALREALVLNQEYIGAMSVEELRRATEEPARRGRWEFEPGLVDLLLHDVGQEPGALPLLSHALLETWQRRRGRLMTLSGYTSSGGVRGAIGETAEAVFSDLFTQQQKQIARRIFLRLTDLGNETSTGDSRRRADMAELIRRPEESDTTRQVLGLLADARLISLDKETVEVAHEALIREWPTLRGWLEDNREGLRLHRQLTEAAHEWRGQGREPDLLYRGARLAQAREWADANPDETNEIEREFLAAGLEAREREAAERETQRERELESARRFADTERQRAEEQKLNAGVLRRRARYLTGAFSVALLMAFTALYFGAQARRVATAAQLAQRIATARELAAAALNNLNVDPERSILLALQAISTTRSVDGTVLAEAEEALHSSLVASPIRLTLMGHETRVLSAAYSPDGRHLATVADDGTAIVWDANTGDQLRRFPGNTVPNDIVTGQRVAYSPQGDLLAVCDSDQIMIYDLATGELRRSLAGHHGDVLAVTMSPDGKHIASGGLDGEVRIWGVASGELLHALAGHTAYIEGIGFSPDGRLLATSGEDATVRIWEVGSGALLHTFTEFPGLVDSVTFSPDGERLAATSDGNLTVWMLGLESQEAGTSITPQEILVIPDGGGVRFSPDGRQIAVIGGTVEVRLLDSGTGRELLNLVGHSGWVLSIAFSPDGNQLATASLDGTVKIWSIAAGREVLAVAAERAGFGTRVAYNPIKPEFVTNAGDGTATIWDASTGEGRLVLAGHEEEVMSVAFSPDGRQLATGSLDASAILWDAATGRRMSTLLGHEIAVRDITFSPDGRRIVTGGFDGTARLWDAETGAELTTLSAHEGLVLGVAFSPDGKRLATSGTDGLARIWDARTGDLLNTFEGQGGIDIAYHPDGNKIAAGRRDGTALIWDANTGLELISMAGHGAEIQSVAFSPDGKLLATGSSDNTAKLWDTETGEEVLTLPGSGGGVSGVAFSPTDDGAHLLVASRDGVVREFLLRLEDLLQLADTRVTRPLTAAECQRYLHIEACPVSAQ